MTTTVPWQLYVFSLLNLVVGIVCFFTSTFTCNLIFGTKQCSAEGVTTVLFPLFSFCMTYIGALFTVLTALNHKRNEHEKLKRLAFIALNCTVAMLVALIMTGPKHLGGVEKGWAHLGDMFTIFALLIIVSTAVVDDHDVAGVVSFSNLFQGLGVNPKTLLWLALVGGTVKLFLVSDFMSYHYILTDDADGSSSELSRVMWNWMVVFILQVLFVLFFAIGYGDYKDQESTVITIAVLSLFYGLFTLIGHKNTMKPSLFRQTIISLVVWIVLAIAAVVGGRRQQGRAGYETVSTNV